RHTSCYRDWSSDVCSSDLFNSIVDRIFNLDAVERNRYGNTAFGAACLTARNLLRANLGTRFIQINLGSWDYHQNLYAQLTPMASQFDSGLGALLVDLKAAGLLDETLIVAQGEFGRTVGPLNSNAGCTHVLQTAMWFSCALVTFRS